MVHVSVTERCNITSYCMLSFSRVFRLTENESRIAMFVNYSCGRYERGSSKLEHPPLVSVLEHC